jgi:DNA-binding MarR family transcriptional regulator
MSNAALPAILRLIRVEATIQARFTGVLGSLHGLSLNELILLMNLDQAPLGRMRRVDLAVALVVSQSSVTRMAAPLEKIGLVARDSDERDARVAYVVLTKAGRERARDATATLTELCQGVFAEHFSAAEVKSLASLLGRLSTPIQVTG